MSEPIQIYNVNTDRTVFMTGKFAKRAPDEETYQHYTNGLPFALAAIENSRHFADSLKALPADAVPESTYMALNAVQKELNGPLFERLGYGPSPYKYDQTMPQRLLGQSTVAKHSVSDWSRARRECQNGMIKLLTDFQGEPVCKQEQEAYKHSAEQLVVASMFQCDAFGRQVRTRDPSLLTDEVYRVTTNTEKGLTAVQIGATRRCLFGSGSREQMDTLLEGGHENAKVAFEPEMQKMLCKTAVKIEAEIATHTVGTQLCESQRQPYKDEIEKISQQFQQKCGTNSANEQQATEAIKAATRYHTSRCQKMAFDKVGEYQKELIDSKKY